MTPASSRQQEIWLQYDDQIDYGSPEHFYHFMWGYFLPAICAISKRSHSEETYVFQDCGPISNKLIGEVASFLGIAMHIAQEIPREAIILPVPRWDIFILYPFLSYTTHAPVGGWEERFLTLRDRLPTLKPDHWERMQTPQFLSWMRAEIATVRDWLLPLFLSRDIGPASDYLVLRRSEEPDFFKPTGGAKSKGYGVVRRSLANVDLAVQELRHNGLHAEAFECGAHSLAEQARRFHLSAGIALIRGAEIANLIWMRPGASIYVLTPERMARIPAPHDGLAELLDLSLTQDLSDSFHPSLDAVQVRLSWRDTRNLANYRAIPKNST